MNVPVSRRRFLATAGGVTAAMVLGTGCSNTYDVPAASSARPRA
jgi:hypothetical protein